MSEKIRVLIVDDEPDIPAVLSPLLEPQFETVVASNGLDALLKLPRYEPDLMIVDLMMPLMDGWQLADRVRKHPDFRDTPMIFLTALDSSDNIKRGYEAGADVYITKPFDPARVLRNVQVFVEQGKIVPRPKRNSIEDIQREVAEQRNATREAVLAGRSGEVSPGSRNGAGVQTLRETRPAQAAAEGPAPGAVPEETVPAVAEFPVPPRVLLVDDDPEILDILRLALQRGFEVVAAHDGFDALTKIPEVQPDLYVIDVMMPKMSGLQLLQVIRQSADTRNAPAIILSAKTSTRDRDYARTLGADAYLVKPFLTSEVIGELERQVRRPGFTVTHPKRKSVEHIHMAMGAQIAEEEKRKKREMLRRTYQVFDEFLAAHGNKDPFTGQ